jgi:hypothetical protein
VLSRSYISRVNLGDAYLKPLLEKVLAPDTPEESKAAFLETMIFLTDGVAEAQVRYRELFSNTHVLLIFHLST